MRIALAQLNPTVGDIDGNATAMAAAYRTAVAEGADLVVTGELGMVGYPPDDLLLKPAFVRAAAERVTELAAEVGAAALLVGFPEDLRGDVSSLDVVSEESATRGLANSVALLRNGAVETTYRKQRIPNYGVFDEARYFRAGFDPALVDVTGTTVGLTVCEDLWGEGGPVADSAAAGASVVLIPNASPFSLRKHQERDRWARHHATTAGVWIVYVNLVGGQDDVVYDGDSFVMASDGQVVARGAQFAEDLVIVDVDPHQASAHPQSWPNRLDEPAAIYEALVLGTRDYLSKNGFARAVLGVSGGLDSALVTAVAVDALGPNQVTAVAMPSPYSSPGSITDAKELVAMTGCRYLEIGIEPMMRAFGEALAESFAGTETGIAEENIQSRCRGMLLMALSNKHGDLVLATGNKSEFAVGYATLYGDMAGGFAPLKDVYKTVAYEVSRYRNSAHRDGWLGPVGAAIPQAILEKPPSAELRPDQRDTDSLPPYEVLDPILRRYIEHYHSVERMVADGFDAELVTRVTRLVDRAEYKRRQAPPGIKVTTRAFGRERRLPITSRWAG